MKTKMIIAAALAATALLASCAKENNNNNNTDDVVNGDGMARMVLQVNTLTPSETRAATTQENAVGDELTLVPASGLKVAIFSTDGLCVYSDELTLTADAYDNTLYRTPNTEDKVITLRAGNYYFFVFANDHNTNVNLEKIVLPAVGAGLEGWMATQFDVEYDNSNGRPDIAKAGEFLLGSLWKEAVPAPANGTKDDPKPVDLTLGRLASKVLLSQIKVTTSTSANLTGAFSDGAYRICSRANGMFRGGVVTTPGRLNPFTAGTIVTSSKHGAASGTLSSPNTTDFVADYAFWKDVTGADSHFYAVENTTALDANTGNQYYGNTTYIQMRTKYTPGTNEVKSIADDGTITTSTTWNGATFWSFGAGDSRVICDAVPSAAALIALGITADMVFEYAGGLNYHAFPIQDVNETDPVAKNRVLRNHFYEFTVDAITDLGSNTPVVNPEKPLDKDTNVVIGVKVGKWNKVTTAGVVVR